MEYNPHTWTHTLVRLAYTTLVCTLHYPVETHGATSTVTFLITMSHDWLSERNREIDKSWAEKQLFLPLLLYLLCVSCWQEYMRAKMSGWFNQLQNQSRQIWWSSYLMFLPCNRQKWHQSFTCWLRRGLPNREAQSQILGVLKVFYALTWLPNPNLLNPIITPLLRGLWLNARSEGKLLSSVYSTSCYSSNLLTVQTHLFLDENPHIFEQNYYISLETFVLQVSMLAR